MQAHFDNLNQFLLKFSNLPYVIFPYETRIKTDPLININILGYTFLHYFSPTNAGGVGVYISNVITFSGNQILRLVVQGCENLWLDIEFPSHKTKYTFAVIYRHPSSNYVPFLEALDKKLQLLNNKGNRAILLDDFNFNLNSFTVSTCKYLQILNANAFISLTIKSTRVTSNSQTTIDHILTNDNNSSISPGVFHFSISDHHPIFCLFPCNKLNVPESNGVYTFRNIKSIDGEEFHNDLESALSPLTYDFMCSNISHENFDAHFDQFMQTICSVIEKHAPLQTMSRKQKRIQQKPWLTKGLLASIKNKQKLLSICFLNGNA